MEMAAPQAAAGRGERDRGEGRVGEVEQHPRGTLSLRAVGHALGLYQTDLDLTFGA
jgi:hypothetical protein